MNSFGSRPDENNGGRTFIPLVCELLVGPCNVAGVIFLEPMTWLTWSLLSAFFAAATAILAKIGIAGIDANLATAVRTSVVVLFTWLLAYTGRPAGGFQALSNKAWVFLVLSGLATGLSWLGYFHALQIGPASRVAPID